ncbi:coiled-coil domain-containing protein 174 [Condylostylus longicornis]|uniref:coiled-coil domain-containing protein 174 n=1 Tax=Condylostylus longicornis TaxID=2530218 RepID=UPI00244E1A7C|nr:coiled-coil domain-containing protein 174 [Condylostylus longicornis]
MNDQKKKIDVNTFSLNQLKAELLRKQEEVKKAKVERPIEKFVPKKAEEKPKVQKDKIDKTSKEKEVKKNYEEYEDSAAFEKAKRVLQAKAKFYDKMVASGGNLNSDDNCLVLFNKKKQDNKPDPVFTYDDDNDDDDEEDNDNNNKNKAETTGQNDVETFEKLPRNVESSDTSFIGEYEATEAGDDWVEYTDCLGRTRKCLRKDFVFCKQKDSELAKNIQPREVVPNPSSTNQVPVAAPPGSMSSLEASVRTKYEAMKTNWENKEKENLEKEFIHYQDVFFDEARQHGVGYYAFSTDDEERARQLRELYELRAETLEEQNKREAERQQRDIILSERVRAAENRLRARQGLPPLEDDTAIQEEKPLTKEERKQKRKEEKMKKRMEKEEKNKEEKRKKHVRPWDKQKIGQKFKKKSSDNSDSDSDSEEEKDNDEWKYRPKREPMSQEQWNEKQRSMRNPEFAPPSSSSSSMSFESHPINKGPPTSGFSYNSNNDDDLDIKNANPFFFTTKKRPFQKKLFVRKNYSSKEKSVSSEEPVGVPIHNEIPEYSKDNDDDLRPPGVSSDNDEDDDSDNEPKEKRKGVEIPPPPTFEYYGPAGTSRPPPAKKPDIESSIEAGLKFLRNQSDKGLFPTKYSYGSKTE